MTTLASQNKNQDNDYKVHAHMYEHRLRVGKNTINFTNQSKPYHLPIFSEMRYSYKTIRGLNHCL